MTTGEIHSADDTHRVRLVRQDGVLVRQGFGPDLSVIKEYPVTYRRMIDRVRGHHVLDIGANIGVFAVRAMEHGATRTTCYEPEPGAVSVLQANIKQFGRRARVVCAAIEARDGPFVTLHVPKSGNSVTATTHFSPRGRTALQVPRVSLPIALEKSGATLIKTDCEGAELDFLNGRRLPTQVRVVCGELHREHGNEERCREIIGSFSRWREIHAPSSYSYARCWTVAWER